MRSLLGETLDEYIARLGWTQDKASGIVSVLANPDNRIESTVVRENIQFPRKYSMLFPLSPYWR